MGVSFSEDRITFRGNLTTGEIKRIVRNGGVDTLQTDMLLNFRTPNYVFTRMKSAI